MANNYIENKDEYLIETKNHEKIPVRKLQLEVLSIMDEIDRVCRKNNIQYFLIAGSSLGSVNYGGFIPWDDDMDISVSIDDWPKFIEAMKKDLSDKFYFDCYETDKRYNTISGPWGCLAFHSAYSRCPSSLSKTACISGSRTRARASTS